MELRTPASVDEALATLNEHGTDARVVAGGTDVMIQLQRGEINVPLLVSVGHLDELAGVRANGGLHIGALATHRRLATDGNVGSAYASIAEGAATVGGWQTQAVATIGGNICNASPAADLAAPLLVNDARVRLQSQSGERELDYGEFVVGRRATARTPDELLTAITLAAPPARSSDVYLKVGRRGAMEVAIVGLAMRLGFDAGGTVTHARVALASVAAVPLRLPAAEAALIGHELTDDAVARAAATVLDGIAPIDDIRGSAAYRRQVLPGLLRRAAARCAARAGVPIGLKEAV